MMNEALIDEINHAQTSGSVAGGIIAGIGGTALTGTPSGWWELGTLIGLMQAQRQIVRKAGINPDSTQGQAILQEARNRTQIGRTINKVLTNPKVVSLHQRIYANVA